jgi:acyl-CoA reductase-like NAD-dependent aldehyde dehydrogenase
VERNNRSGAGQKVLRIAELREWDKEEFAEFEMLDTEKTVEEIRKYMEDILVVFRYFGGH